jgi:multisubunit Na+/H+ antiporter MnhB subunit
MGTNDLLSEKEVLKKLAKEEKDKKKNKKARRDAWTAVAVIATIMLIAVGLSFYKTSNVEIKEYSGRSLAKEHQKRETTRNIIIGLGVVCTGVLVIALVNRSKNKSDGPSKEEQNRAEQRKLDEARVRVEEARRNRLNEEANVTMTRHSRESMHSRLEGNQGSISDRGNMSMMDMEDREAYLERRKKEYQYYMENELEDGEEIEEDEMSSGGRTRRSYRDDSKRKKFIIGIAIGVIALVITLIIVLL